MEFTRPVRHALFVVSLAAAVLVGASGAVVGVCGPFTDVAADAFCPFVLEVFTLGITTGTSPTTYDPASSVSRLQMAAFLSRGVDGVLKRGSRRASMKHFWTSKNDTVLGLTTVGTSPIFCAPDGADIWVSNSGSVSVTRVRANDGKLLETWTGFTGGSPTDAVVAMGRVIVAGNPANLYTIDASQPAGVATLVASNLGINPALPSTAPASGRATRVRFPATAQSRSLRQDPSPGPRRRSPQASPTPPAFSSTVRMSGLRTSHWALSSISTARAPSCRR
jgi:hypothetical protein